MLASILSSYAEDDESPSGAAGGSSESSAAGAATSVVPPVSSEFSAQPTKKRVDLTRLQMCCPGIIGAGEVTGSSFGAHSLFAIRRTPSSAPAAPSAASGLSFPVPQKGRNAAPASASAKRSPAAGSPQDASALPAPDVVVGPDNVPLLRYARGVFASAEEEDLEEFRQLKQQQHRLRKQDPETVRRAAAASPEADGLPPPSTRSQALLRMLPMPQSASPAQGGSWSALCLGARTAAAKPEEPPKAAQTKADAEAQRQGGRSKHDAASAGEDFGPAGADVGGAKPASGSQKRPAGGSDPPAEAEKDTEEADGASGPLFSLFSDYNDDEKQEEPDTDARLLPVKQEPLPSSAPAKSGAEASSAPFSSFSSAPSVFKQQKAEASIASEFAQAAAPLYGPEVPAEAANADVWSGEQVLVSGDHDDSQPLQMMQGMSLREYRELQKANVGVVSGEALRDPNWQVNAQLHGTPAQAKRAKLTITTNVWSAKTQGVVQTQEPGGMQKRKHQINWLAAEAAEKELEMWEMLSKNRQNKYQTAMKYGW
ncbi:hypothetical protein BESB_059440 [Besnoitia besnoiti]|uniref:Mitotic checkpoint prcc-carboxy-term protein n=1 Tax=Besnoitia besnoiti TaxID=94643 RepID=A0A2A9MHJ0_BESBE|nr:hypothetical protein BESB_059440 [Besnoitia besnoiti]PFH35057.1 hypothetical protein BESB_059440 [Besnoitia besnoiti]